MTSQQIKAAFAAQGIKVRVKALPHSFRVCTVDGSAHTSLSNVIVEAIGGRGYINQAHEMFVHIA